MLQAEVGGKGEGDGKGEKKEKQTDLTASENVRRSKAKSGSVFRVVRISSAAVRAAEEHYGAGRG
jgi:P pilus assembly chaperone PapD